LFSVLFNYEIYNINKQKLGDSFYCLARSIHYKNGSAVILMVNNY